MMKKVVRKGTFETNSSSSHSLTIMTQDKWNEFETTDKWLADWDGELKLVDDLIERMKEEAEKYPDLYKDVDLNDRQSCINYLTSPKGRWGSRDYYTYDTWGDYEWSDWAECYVEKFETPSGDKLVAVGAYGYNG